MGRRWTNGFSVVILRRNQRKFTGAGITLRRLYGRDVQTRGFIERRRGSLIEVDTPEQIEIVD